MPVHAPLNGEITLDSLNPPHGKITGTVDLPAAAIAGGVKFEGVPVDRKVPPNSMAIATYHRGGTQVITIHFGPEDLIQNTYRVPSTPVVEYEILQAVVIRSLW